MESQNQFYNGRTGQLEIMLEPVLYHDTDPPMQNGWTVWCIDWDGVCEHFTDYNKARDRYEELIKSRI